MIQAQAELLGDVRIATIHASWRRLTQHPRLLMRDVARVDVNGTDIAREPEADDQVAEWVRKALVPEDSNKVAHDDLLHSFHGWQRSELGDDVRLLNVRTFVPRLKLFCPFVTPLRVLVHHYAGGVMLNAEGLRYWERHRGCGSRGIAFSSEYVNSVWKGRSQHRAFKPTPPPREASSP
jgi:hypothetical protein